MRIENLDTHPKQYVSPAAFADYLDKSPRTVYAWIEKGALEVQRLPTGTVLIPIAVARAFVRGGVP